MGEFPYSAGSGGVTASRRADSPLAPVTSPAGIPRRVHSAVTRRPLGTLPLGLQRSERDVNGRQDAEPSRAAWRPRDSNPGPRSRRRARGLRPVRRCSGRRRHLAPAAEAAAAAAWAGAPRSCPPLKPSPVVVFVIYKAIFFPRDNVLSRAARGPAASCAAGALPADQDLPQAGWGMLPGRGLPLPGAHPRPMAD